MEYKLYVGNLAYSVTEEELQTLFAQAGAVKSVALIKDKFTGQSKGFAFVEMETQQDMDNAINMFSGKDFKDRPLTVNIARPREERGGFGGNRGGGGGNRFNDRNRKPRSGSGGGGKQRW